MPKKKQFVPIVAGVVAVIAIGGLVLWRTSPTGEKTPWSLSQNGDQISQAEWPVLWGAPGQNCQEKASVTFTTSPIAPSDITVVEPMGELREGHIVPGDHVGIEYKTSPTSAPVNVFAPADGTIVSVERHAYTPPPGYPPTVRHYHVYLVHSCTLFTGFVHVTEFAPQILAASSELKKLNDENVREYKQTLVNIPVTAGQQIGTAWSFGLLGAVTVDLRVTNSGYLNAQSYRGENWRPHAVSLFDYLAKPLQAQVFAKNPRTAEPRGGKIDFDVDGTLSGNWFEQDSGGFRDESKKPRLCGNFPCPYWNGHLALVYDFIDPTQLRVSIGHNWGLAGRTPFGVKGNGPNFKGITAATGVMKYELVSLKDVSRERGYNSASALITANDESHVLGTMLVQMLGDRIMKMEIFPGKTKAQVQGFTGKAKTYER